MTEEKYYKPCSTCHNTDCVWMGGQDTHKKCEDYQALEQEPTTETVTEFADRCRECGAKYGRQLRAEGTRGDIPIQPTMPKMPIKQGLKTWQELPKRKEE